MLYLARDHMTNGSLFQEAEHMFFKKFSCWCGWWGWIQRQLCEFQRHRMRCFWVSLLDWPTCLIVEASEAWRGSVIFQRSQGWFVVLIIQLLPVLLCLLCSEVAQTYVHRVNDAIQPSHLLSPPSPLALNLSQHQDLFQWVGSSHQVTKVLELQLQHQSWCWKDHIFPTQLCHTPPKQQTPLCSLCVCVCKYRYSFPWTNWMWKFKSFPGSWCLDLGHHSDNVVWTLLANALSHKKTRWWVPN